MTGSPPTTDVAEELPGAVRCECSHWLVDHEPVLADESSDDFFVTCQLCSECREAGGFRGT